MRESLEKAGQGPDGALRAGIISRFTDAARAQKFCSGAAPHQKNAGPSGEDLLVVKRLVSELLGSDTKFEGAENKQQAHCNLYAATNGKNMELLAALELKRVAEARNFISDANKNWGASLKIIWGTWAEEHKDDPEFETRKRTFEAAEFSKEVRSFLANAHNREAMRQRFPEAGFTDEHIDSLLNGSVPALQPPEPPELKIRTIPCADNE